MFCLVTIPHGLRGLSRPELAAVCRWRWDGSERALREAKTVLRGAGPGTGPNAPLRLSGPGPAGTPHLAPPAPG